MAVWNIGNTSVHNMPEVTLNLPGRDEKRVRYGAVVLSVWHSLPQSVALSLAVEAPDWLIVEA